MPLWEAIKLHANLFKSLSVQPPSMASLGRRLCKEAECNAQRAHLDLAVACRLEPTISLDITWSHGVYLEDSEKKTLRDTEKT